MGVILPNCLLVYVRIRIWAESRLSSDQKKTNFARKQIYLLGSHLRYNIKDLNADAIYKRMIPLKEVKQDSTVYKKKAATDMTMRGLPFA
jgi:hypothetical protein